MCPNPPGKIGKIVPRGPTIQSDAPDTDVAPAAPDTDGGTSAQQRGEGPHGDNQNAAADGPRVYPRPESWHRHRPRRGVPAKTARLLDADAIGHHAACTG